MRARRARARFLLGTSTKRGRRKRKKCGGSRFVAPQNQRATWSHHSGQRQQRGYGKRQVALIRAACCCCCCTFLWGLASWQSCTPRLPTRSELIRPTVVTFLDKMLLDKDRSLRMDEITIAEGSASVGKAINNLGLEHVPGMLLLAIRSTDGDWEYNPRRSTRVRAGSVLVFLGTPEDSRSLRDRLDPDTNERAVQ